MVETKMTGLSSPAQEYSPVKEQMKMVEKNKVLLKGARVHF